ncbi:RNA-guided endonuclease InsQ/TnpB family protein [Bacillus taeanensis]|uniref:Transposase n=1 Tax=Bacillus taeanensis TaxID=273032 RepID=A0A366Y3G4_9BACI|nr:RNA-guided endonuclease TnpB family protein [Bacillus taeanensis]RBW70731.1 transposase [Bacillus taeanensis]
MEKGKETHYKTHQIWIKKGHRMYPYFKEMAQNAKNMTNTTNFYIRQVYTGLTQEKELQPLQKEVLAIIEKNLDNMNGVQKSFYLKKIEKEKTKPKEQQKSFTCHVFEAPSKAHPYVDYNFLDCLFKVTAQHDYRSLPTQTSQSIMKTVFQNWKSFFSSLKEYKKNPAKYKGRPRIPKYSRASEKEVLFTNQDCVIKEKKFLKFPKTKERLNIGKLGAGEGKLKQVRVIPKYGQYVVELVMDVPLKKEECQEINRLMAIDLGIDNLATIVTNTGSGPVLVKGRHVKSINQYYNKMKAHYLGILRRGKQPNEGPFTSKRLEKLHQIRHQKLKDLFHKVSFSVIKHAQEENIDTIIIGKNNDWKQSSTIGKCNNQSFVSIPHSLFIRMIQYKAKEQGIKVIVTEESYTSKASFLDGDEIPTYGECESKKTFSGKRIKRGLYRSKAGFIINADVNGAANILKKAFLRLKEEAIFHKETIHVWHPQSKII